VRRPLQYLFNLLLYAERSTYQFIESQTNRLYLLHEATEAVVGAKARAIECEGEGCGAARVKEMKPEKTQSPRITRKQKPGSCRRSKA
jgi:hypothetical protein